MSWSQVWRQLDIAATDDVSLIRKAYAKKLKQCSPEDRPVEFQQLRAAYEHALVYARNGWHRANEQHSTTDATSESTDELENDELEDDESAEPVQHSVDASEAEQSAAESQQTEPITASQEPEVVRHLRESMNAIRQWLFANPPPKLEELQFTVKSVLESELLQQVTVYLDVERTLAEWLARSVPRSDDIIEMVATAFNWHEARDIGKASPAIEYLLSRVDDLQWARSLHDPQHEWYSKWHRAAEYLADPPPPRWRREASLIFNFTLEGKLQHLVQRLQHERRGVIDQFNSESVECWAEHFSKPRLSRPQFGGGLLVIIVAGLVALMGGDTSHPAKPLALVLGLIAGMGPVLLAVLKFAGTEWPSHWWKQHGCSLTARRWSHSWVVLGWLSALIASLSNSTWLTLCIGIAMVAVVYIATAFLRIDRPRVTPSAQLSPFGRIFSIIGFVCASIFMHSHGLDDPEKISTTVIVFVVLMELSYGRLYRDCWEALSSVTQRKVLMGALLAIALAILIFVLSQRMSQRDSMLRDIGLIATGILLWSLLVAQRGLLHACTERQRNIRATLLTTSSIPIGLYALDHAEPNHLALNTVFVVYAAAYTLATCLCVLYNLRKQRIEN